MNDVIVAVICKNEYDYIREFVEYHLNIGFDRIVIGDNNDNNGETYDELLKDLIDEGKVKIISLRGMETCQKQYYNMIMQNEPYEWCAFIDTDEFITFSEECGFKNIKDFLDYDKKVKAYKLNWQVFGDNDIVRYEKGKNVTERFTTPKPKDFLFSYTFSENAHTKSILRKDIKGEYLNNPHTILTLEHYYTPLGKEKDNSPFNFDVEWDVLFIRHFYTKTIEEWAKFKLNRGYADVPSNKKDTYGFDKFFRYNEINKDKMEFLREYYENERKC